MYNRKEGEERGSPRTFAGCPSEVSGSGLTGTKRSVRLLIGRITQSSPEEGQVAVEAPLVSACTFYILYEASSVASAIATPHNPDAARRLLAREGKTAHLKPNSLHIYPSYQAESVLL